MWYLKSAFDTYQNVQDAVQSRFKDVRSAALSPLNLVKNLLTPPPEQKPEDELEQLRRRVAELEQRQQKPRTRGKRRQTLTAGGKCAGFLAWGLSSEVSECDGPVVSAWNRSWDRSHCGLKYSSTEAIRPVSHRHRGSRAQRQAGAVLAERDRKMDRPSGSCRNSLVPGFGRSDGVPLVRDAFQFLFERLCRTRRLGHQSRSEQFELSGGHWRPSSDSSASSTKCRDCRKSARCSPATAASRRSCAAPSPSWKTACPT